MCSLGTPNYCLFDVPVDASSSTETQGSEKGTGRVCELDCFDCGWLDDIACNAGLWTLDEDTGLLLI